MEQLGVSDDFSTSSSSATIALYNSTSSTGSMTAMQEVWGQTAVVVLAIALVIFIIMAAIGNLLVMAAVLISWRKCDR